MNKRLSLLIKPASDACNMKCSYCFYSDVSSHRKTEAAAACQEKKSCVMNKNVSCAVIEKAAAYAERAHFAFQGGEPTLAGIDFFEYFVSEAEKFFPGRADFSIQTNGLLLDEDFCAFLAEKSFLVGISLDGYEEIHDLYRSDCSGNGSWKRVMAAIDRLRKHGVRYNVLSVVTNQLAKRADKLMRFFQREDFGYIQLTPCLAPLGAPGGKYALRPEQYALFLKEFFALWLDELKAGTYRSVRLFDNVVRMFCKRDPEMCGMCGKCSLQYVIESNGNVYPCDFYALDEYLMGNILTDDFVTLSESSGARTFLSDGLSGLPSQCGECVFSDLCGGSCRRYRSFLTSKEGYCPYRDFLSACAPGILYAGKLAFG